jgi:hypothetical protein
LLASISTKRSQLASLPSMSRRKMFSAESTTITGLDRAPSSARAAALAPKSDGRTASGSTERRSSLRGAVATVTSSREKGGASDATRVIDH